MSTKQASTRKPGAKGLKSAKASVSTELRSPNSNVLSGLEDLDEETLLSLSLDVPVRLTPPPFKNDTLTSESSPTPLSKMRVSSEVMNATLERLGFGPPNDLSNLPTLPSPTPENFEVSTAGHKEKAPSSEASGDSGPDCLDAYGQISQLFQQIAQRTGHSVSTLILEWALLHAHHGHMSKAKTATHQQAFEEEVGKVVNLVGFSFHFTLSVIDYGLSGF